MMRILLSLLCLGVLGGCAENPRPNTAKQPPNTVNKPKPTTPTDPIDTLAKRLSATSGIWVNGLSPALELPESASSEEIVAKFFQSVSYDEGPVTRHQILETRPVQITDTLPNPKYTAVLVDTNLGRKVLLYQYSVGGWWTRVYDDAPAS